MEEKDEFEVLEIPEDQVPEVVVEKFNQLTDLKNEIQTIQDNAVETKNNADAIKDKKIGLFKKKDAIKELQTLTADMAQNQVANAEITNKILIYQQKTAETMKFLLGLGVTNLATNRAVVKQLKDKLSEKESGNLDEYEEKEILAVLRQLKAQEDILEKQERIGEKINSLQLEVNNLKKQNEQLVLELGDNSNKIEFRKVLIFAIVMAIVAVAALIVSILAIVL